MVVAVAAVVMLIGVARPAAACTTPEPIAHRGARREAPENSREAVRAALDIGSRWVEVDVRFSQSHFPFVLHDRSLRRTTTGTGYIDQLPVDRIRAATLANGEPVPLFREVLRDVRQRGGMAVVEIKARPTDTELARLIGRIQYLQMTERVIITSFDRATIRLFQAAFPDVETSLTTATTVTPWTVRSFGGLSVRHDQVTEETMAQWQPTGRRILAWTADRSELWEELATLGVWGVVTNDVRGYVEWAAARCAPLAETG